jgi:hypothetical protein
LQVRKYLSMLLNGFSEIACILITSNELQRGVSSKAARYPETPFSQVQRRNHTIGIGYASVI